MNHSYLAGGFCTLATIILVVEIILGQKIKVSPKFILFYSVGCLFWATLGVVSNQVPLFFIGMIQFFALLSAYLLLYKTDGENATS